MGRLLKLNDIINESSDEYSIRIPLKMVQLTEKDGRVYPLAFDWESNGDIMRVNIDRINTIAPLAEQKNGAVGDRFECEIEGRIEYLYYSKLQPRKWFLIQKVSEEEYNTYYKLPGGHTEKNRRPMR